MFRFCVPATSSLRKFPHAGFKVPPGVAIPPPVAAGGSAADEEDAMPKEDPSKLERAPGEENEEVPTLLDVTLSIITHFPQILTLSPLLVQLFENCPSAKVSIHAPYLMAAILSDTGTFNCGQRERETSYTGCGVCTALNVAPIMGLSAFMRRNVPKQIKLIPDVNPPGMWSYQYRFEMFSWEGSSDGDSRASALSYPRVHDIRMRCRPENERTKSRRIPHVKLICPKRGLLGPKLMERYSSRHVLHFQRLLYSSSTASLRV